MQMHIQLSLPEKKGVTTHESPYCYDNFLLDTICCRIFKLCIEILTAQAYFEVGDESVASSEFFFKSPTSRLHKNHQL